MALRSPRGFSYDTLTRHLQTWHRFKGFWGRQYGEGSNQIGQPELEDAPF